MTAWRLIIKEITYRKGSFLLGLLSVVIAMTVWIGSDVLLRAQDMLTERLLIERERETQAEMQRMEDDYRRIMRDLGYNVMIVSAAQDMAVLRAMGHPDTTMPYDYAERLGRGGIETLNHLLPVLQHRMTWPEHDVEIILSGTPGQVPVVHLTHFLMPDGRTYRNPIMETIPPGELVLGHDVARRLDLNAGDEVVLMGDTFRVSAINPAEGTSDDIAVWCNLEWAQRQLEMQNRINLILALECVCDAGSLGRISAEVRGILPDVQVMEFSSRVQARALARNRAAEAHRTALDAEREHRARMTSSHRRFAAVLVPLVVAAAALWMVFVFLGNVRERLIEIGILRAIGINGQTLLAVFLAKSFLMGLAGAVIGYVAGNVVGSAWAGIAVFSKDFQALMQAGTLGFALLAAPALCMLAAWAPVVWALRRDPASILCEG